MNNHNAYVRLQTYYSWLINSEGITHVDDSYKQGMPLGHLAKITDIPISIVRQDFLCMFQWQSSMALASRKYDSTHFLIWHELIFDDDSEEYHAKNKSLHLEQLYDQIMSGSFPERFGELLLHGDLDTIPIFLNTEASETTYKLPLSQNEAAALRLLEKNNPLLQKNMNEMKHVYSRLYDIKDNPMFTYQYNNLNEKLDLINDAISTGYRLRGHYKTSPGKHKTLDIKPLKISYDADENLYAVLSINHNRVMVNRLDRLETLEENPTVTPEQENQDTSLLDIYPNVWGNCFSEKPEKVKVRFYNEAHVWEKVKKELANRTNGKLYEKDGCLYYEDIVYGINKFRSWIYGFGRSAIVLEPRSLRKDIIRSLKERQAGS